MAHGKGLDGGCGNTGGNTVGGPANNYQVGGSHYKAPIQHWDYVLANEIPYLEAQAIRYLTRWRKKGGHQDLRKAQHYLKKIFESEGLDWVTGENIEEHRKASILRGYAEELDRHASGGVAGKESIGPAEHAAAVPPRNAYKHGGF